MSTYTVTIPSPCGELLLVADEQAIVGLHFLDGNAQQPRAPGSADQRTTPLLELACQQLDEYFAGHRRQFDLPLQPAGTGFQQRVWAELQNIPYGTTWTYGEQARRLGMSSAVRAVGSANGRNPIAIIIPCHRVIGSNGTLTGYGGGLERKRQLLDFEAGHVDAWGRQGNLFSSARDAAAMPGKATNGPADQALPDALAHALSTTGEHLGSPAESRLPHSNHEQAVEGKEHLSIRLSGKPEPVPLRQVSRERITSRIVRKR